MGKSDGVYQGHFLFDPADPIYADHFPGNPVVPGSLIIHAFMSAVRSEFEGRGAWRVENFRFVHFISPGRYSFRVERQADGCFRCTLYTKGRKAMTGSLVPEPLNHS